MGCCKAEKRKTSVHVYKTGINVNLTITSEELFSKNITSQKENNNNTKKYNVVDNIIGSHSHQPPAA